MPRETTPRLLSSGLRDAVSKDGNRECFVSNEGEVRVSEYDGKSISLIADVNLVNDAGDSAATSSSVA